MDYKEAQEAYGFGQAADIDQDDPRGKYLARVSQPVPAQRVAPNETRTGWEMQSSIDSAMFLGQRIEDDTDRAAFQSTLYGISKAFERTSIQDSHDVARKLDALEGITPGLSERERLGFQAAIDVIRKMNE